MAIVTHIVVRFAITANLGNFNSVQSSLEYGLELEPGEEVETITARYQQRAQDEVMSEIQSVKGPKPKKKAPDGDNLL